jgi:hypothetical protein
LAASGDDGSGDPRAASIAWRALGLVAMYGHRLELARSHLDRAIAVAADHDLPALGAEARLTLAATIAMSGDVARALAETERAGRSLAGVGRARMQAQRAVMLDFEGRTTEASDAYRAAITGLRRHGDRLWEARARHNRGIMRLEQGDVAKARSDLLASDRLLAELDKPGLRVQVAEHLARVEAMLGDLPSALAWFARVDELMDRLGTTDPPGLIDRSAVLRSARLGEEAAAAARTAIAELRSGGNQRYLAEARLALAESCLLTGQPQVAAEEATVAKEAFTRQKAAALAARAGFVAVQARWTNGERSDRLLRAARASADALDRAGWSDAAAEARLLAGQVAVDLGRPAVARAELQRAARVRGVSPAPVRVRAWHATALLRQLDGDRRGVRSALRTGLRVVDAHRATLGATELRARAAGHGTELASIGLRMALADGSAADGLTWSERFRAGALQVAPPAPAHDPAVVRDLGELRRLATEIESAALAGADIAPLRRRQVALEAAVTRRVRAVQGRSTALTRTLPVDELAAALGDWALVELLDVDGVLHAVVAVGVGGGARRSPVLVALGPSASVDAELAAARFALRRLAFGRGSAASLDAARVALAEAAKRLDGQLLAPVASAVGDRPLVISPTGDLHALPWALLPSLTGRPLTITPSASLWLDAGRVDGARPRGRSRRRVALIAGPGLPGAGPEVAALARRYPDAIRLTGRNATESAVKAAIDGAGLAHIAAHGRFRADNPLFSALDLADGPLTVHDLETLRRPPETVVLSACDSGLSSVQPGDELLGLAASLLGLGSRTLVASLLPVPDQATRSLMLDFHRRLRSGRPPAEALAGAQAIGLASGDDAAVAAAASFVCLGRG